ncbi:hypothetical protein G6F24_017077 [Rhizopus arrhizus]|nr:hypothetical protein G6F24_017077 [Rhizopus arrhizus]
MPALTCGPADSGPCGGAGRLPCPVAAIHWQLPGRQAQKNPEDCCLPGFLVTTEVVGETGFEPATSTSRT